MKMKTKTDIIVDIILVIIMVIIGIICIYPIWYVIIASISDPTSIASGKVLFLPNKITFDGYKKLFDYPEIWRGYINTFFYLFAGTFASLAVTLPAAYALSRKQLKGRRTLNFLFTISMYFSGGLIPSYLINSFIGWNDTIWVMIIPTALNVYNMIIARSAFESLPSALYESAQLDGASEFRFFFQFAIPLAKATIAVIFLFEGISWWNQYMRFVIYIDNPNLQSLQVIIHQITDSISSSLGESASAGLVAETQRQLEIMKYSVVVAASLPIIILYPFVQKYFNQGVMVGAVKE